MGITAHKPKDEDYVEKDVHFLLRTTTSCCFSSLGKVYSVKGYEIPEANRTARGRAVVNIVRLDQGEKIESVLPVTEGDGRIYRDRDANAASSKRPPRRNTTASRKTAKSPFSLPEGDEVISVQLHDGRQRAAGRVESRASVSVSRKADVRAMGRTATGVRAMRLSGRATSWWICWWSIPNWTSFTLTSNGYGKRSSVEDYRLQSRGGKGIKAGVFNEKTGELVNLKLVSDDNDIMIITTGGTIIRMHADSISPYRARDARRARDERQGQPGGDGGRQRSGTTRRKRRRPRRRSSRRGSRGGIDGGRGGAG